MVFLLSGDVLSHRINLRKADGENAVTVLPREVLQFRASGFQPERGGSFGFLDHGGRFARARERAKEMNVISHSADDDGLTIELGQDPAEVFMQFLPQQTVVEEWAAVFRGESRVNQNLCERLWHGARMSEYQKAD